MIPNPHALSQEKLIDLLKTDPKKGLTEEEIGLRGEKYGVNQLPPPKVTSGFYILLKQFKNPLIYILVIAALITFFFKKFIDTGVILAAVLFDVILGFVQEKKARDAIASLRGLLEAKAKVIRGGREIEIDAAKIVPGDLLVIEAGDKVIADARLVESLNLKTDESLLTGESTPVNKVKGTLKEETIVSDQKNMVFMGTTAVVGRGEAVVTNIGRETQMGKIAQSVQRAEEVLTPLQINLEKLSRVIIATIGILCLIVFLIGILRGESALTMFLFGVSLAVSTIPEGLVVAIVILLAMGMWRMAKRNAIIRHLPAVETLGAATVIVSDKTGTLTQNQMTVREVFIDQKTIFVSGEGYTSQGNFILSGKNIKTEEISPFKTLLEVGMLCNNASLQKNEKGEWEVVGDPTEAALLVLAEKGGLRLEKIGMENPRILEIPFSEGYKYMVTVHELPNEEKMIAFKGAPGEIIKLCFKIYDQGKILDFDQKLKDLYLNKAREMAGRALRVMALGFSKTSGKIFFVDHQVDTKEWIFLGLVGVIDPVRGEALPAVKEVQEAGVKVMMVTGDHRLTAKAIGEKIGLPSGEVLKGIEIDKMSQEELKEALKRVSIFARVTPEHKLKIVKALQGQGEVVAMTGDGVNDAPALVSADIGVAMGKGGTDVAREAADMVLADNNFVSIAAAVEEGRVVFENLRKVTLYLLSTNFGELLVIVSAMFLGLPLPLTPAQILWLNLVTDGLPDNAMVFEPMEEEVMRKPPRKKEAPVISPTMVFRILIFGAVMAVGTLALFIINHETSLVKAQTLSLTSMAIFQLFNAFNCQSEEKSFFKIGFLRNKLLTGAVFLSFLFQLAVVYLKPFQTIFKTAALSLNDWLIVLGLGILIIFVEEIRKILARYKIIRLG